MLPKIFLCFVFSLLISLFSFAQPKEFSYKNDLYVRQISQNCFIHWVILINNSKATTSHVFGDSLEIKLDDKNIKLYYFGPAHTLDNIVVYIPFYSRRIVSQVPKVCIIFVLNVLIYLSFRF